MIEGRDDGGDQLRRRVLQIGAEQRIAHDLETGGQHRAIDVDDRALGKRHPPIGQAFGGRTHARRETGQMLPMERRLHQSSLTQPERAVAGQQPLPGDEAQSCVLKRVL